MNINLTEAPMKQCKNRRVTKSGILRDFTVIGVPNKEMHMEKRDFRHF